MTFRELESWRTKHNVPDTWWVSVNGVVQEEPLALAIALQIKSQQPETHVALLNNIYANQENPTWVELSLETVQLTRAPFQAAAATSAKAAEPKAAAAAATASAAPTAAIPADFLEKFTRLVAEFEALKKEVADLRKIADTYKDSFAEAKAILDEREAFLDMSETQLFEKAQKQEVRNTELDQRQDNIERREKSVKEAESKLA